MTSAILPLICDTPMRRSPFGTLFTLCPVLSKPYPNLTQTLPRLYPHRKKCAYTILAPQNKTSPKPYLNVTEANMCFLTNPTTKAITFQSKLKFTLNNPEIICVNKGNMATQSDLCCSATWSSISHKRNAKRKHKHPMVTETLTAVVNVERNK